MEISNKDVIKAQRERGEKMGHKQNLTKDMKLQIQELYKPKQVQYKENTEAHFGENQRQREISLRQLEEKVKMPAKMLQ